MRAIEQGRYLARAANTGISGVVDPYGRVVAKSAIFEQMGMVVDVRFLQGRTVYSRIGDVVAYASLAVDRARAGGLPRRPALDGQEDCGGISTSTTSSGGTTTSPGAPLELRRHL